MNRMWLILLLLLTNLICNAQLFEFNQSGFSFNSKRIEIGQNIDSLYNLMGKPERFLKNRAYYDSIGFIAVIDTITNRIKETHLVLRDQEEGGTIKNCGVVNFFGLFINQSTPATMISQSQLKLSHGGYGDYISPFNGSVLVMRTQFNKTVKVISIINEWKEPGVEVVKIRGKRRISINEGDIVWLRSTSKKRPQPFQLARINEQELVFVPLSKKQDEVTVSPEAFSYFEITTFDTALRGIVINTAVVGIYVVNYLVLPGVSVLCTIITLGKTPVYKPVSIYLPFIDFHKHVKVFDKSGNRIWGVNLVNSHSIF